MMGMRWVIRFIGLINTIILARLLTPDDFGIIAMAMVVAGLVEMFAEFGIEGLLLRQEKPTKDMYNNGWTIQLALGVVVGAVIFLSAPLVADFYGDARVELVIQIVSLRAFLSGFVNIGVIDFRRNLEFGKEFRFWVYTRIAQFFLAIGLVLYFGNYIGMALSIPLAMAVKVVISYLMSPYRPRISMTNVRPFWDFAKWILSSNFAIYINERGDEFVVASVAPAKVVGEYYVASDISTMLTREVLLPTNRAMYPIYTRIKNNVSELFDTFHLAFCFGALIAFPIGAGAASVGKDFVDVILGPQWTEAVPFFQCLAIYGAFAAIVSIFRPMLIVQGYEKVSAYVQISQSVISLSALFIAAIFGEILDIAITRTFVMIWFFLFYCWILKVYCGQTAGRIFQAVWRPLVASLLMYFVVIELHHVLFVNKYLSLLFDVLVGVCTYVAVIFGLWTISGRPDGAEAEILAWLKNRALPISV